MLVRFAPDAPECPDSRLISFHSTGHSEEAGQGRGRREWGPERRVGEGETIQCPGSGWNGERLKWPTLSLEVEVSRLC